MLPLTAGPSEDKVDESFAGLREHLYASATYDAVKEYENQCLPSGENRMSHILGWRVPVEMSEALENDIRDACYRDVDNAISRFQNIYTPLFDGVQIATLWYVLLKCNEWVPELSEAGDEPILQKLVDLNDEWDEEASDNFNDTFAVPLFNAVTYHKEFLEQLRIAVIAELQVQVAVRKSLFAIGESAKYAMGASQDVALGDVSLIAGTVGTVLFMVPAVSTTLGIVSAATGWLDKVLDDEVKVELSMEFDALNPTAVSFNEAVETVCEAIQNVKSARDESRENFAAELSEAFKGPASIFGLYNHPPDYLIPGSTWAKG